MGLHGWTSFRLEGAVDLPDRSKIESLCIAARRAFVFDLLTEPGQHLDLEMPQIVTGDRVAGRDRYRRAVVHLQHAAARSEMMFHSCRVAPAHHGYGESGQEVGMSRQDAESAGRILRAQMHDAIGFSDD